MNGGPLSWSRLERILSGIDTEPITSSETSQNATSSGFFPTRAGTATMVSHQDESPSVGVNQRDHIPFAELHACSAYSFLRGASSPAEMVDSAAELGLEALALVDRDGVYGAVQFAEAAADSGIATIFGAELTLTPSVSSPQAASASAASSSSASPLSQSSVYSSQPASSKNERILTVLCRGAEGYRRLSRVISDAHMCTGEKNEVRYPPIDELARRGGDHWIILADYSWTPHLDELVEHFPQVVVELDRLLVPDDADRHEEQLEAAEQLGLAAVYSSAATAARPKSGRLAGAKTALRYRKDVEDAEPYTHPIGGTYLRSGAEMFDAEYPELTANTLAVARDCAFTLTTIAPELPDWPVPEGYTEITWLEHMVEERGAVRYGSREDNHAAWAQIDHELNVIGSLNFPGYFLIVTDLVDFCRRANILAQGRGSSANSAVCFALGITNVDPVAADLLFERFLSPEREGPPDIDLDIESGRREEVIQYCYNKYGRENAAQVANVITYRRRGALRDAARALGYSPGRIDAWVRGLDDAPNDVATLAEQLRGQPRHLGIHSGGMVICDRPIADVVPVEWARMENRSIIQWDKDDAASGGLVKFDLLGLGMLEAIHHAIDQVRDHRGRTVNLWQLGLDDPEVYAMLARADAVGVFQVESRAQMSALPRLKPREFYDLVVQVALIRPGPIQGGSVHPYIRRRNGEEEVTFDHPCLKDALSKTLGVPLFQEQVMRVAVDAAGFTPVEADALRRAMGSKRSAKKMEQLHARFARGCLEKHGMDEATIATLWKKIIAFAAYGFPESHAQSFASIVYFSAWFKRYYPAEFCVALLRAQPMGFYSPQSLIADARRHGVDILPIDVNHSDVEATAIDNPGLEPGAANSLRLGLGAVKGLGARGAKAVVQARHDGGPFTRIADLSRRAGISVSQVEALATAGALRSMGIDRREGLWAAGIAAHERPGMLPGMSEISIPSLPGMSAFEFAAADIASTGITADIHPVELLRKHLDNAGIVSIRQLASCEDSTRVTVAGTVTHRQRPGTAGGVVFLGLEDETGLANITVSPGCWTRYRTVAQTSRMVAIRGIVHNAAGAVAVVADRIDSLDTTLGGAALAGPSRDFR